MVSADGTTTMRGRGSAFLAAIVGIAMLAWPALINRQPFFFSDTSSYVRAGDMVAHLIFGPRAATVWTRPDIVAATSTDRHDPGAAPSIGAARARGNDPASGYIMAGRSPYFGALLWLAWVASRFWLFVVAQAAVAYVLIGLALRAFGVDRRRERLIVCAGLSLLTPLALYDGVLLADALSGFGILAFLILATPRVRLAGWERVLLVLLMVASVASHLTHVVMLLAMAGLLVLLAMVGRLDWRRVRAPLILAAGVLVAGAVSIAATSFAIRQQFGKPPVLVPLMTARFVADGPGRDYIEAGCDGRRFAVCTIPYRGWTNSTNFLWSTDPAVGAFLPADPETRLRMSQEDKAFARAVALSYPVRVAAFAVWNSLLQITDLRVDIVDERCFADPVCNGGQFPQSVMREMAGTAAGQGRWPLAAMNAIVYIAAVASLALLTFALPRLLARDPSAGRSLSLWLALTGMAMAINSFLGGAISEPQSRYQTRMWWLVPLISAIALLALRAARDHAGRGRAG